MTKLNPYISFNGKAREAIEFYKTVFGGELTMSTFKQGGMVTDESDAEKIMHAMLIIGPEMTLMVSDTPKHMAYKPAAGFSVSLSGESSDEQKLKGYWDKLSEGANVAMPLNVAPWGDTFGMLTDKFGIDWMVNIAAKQA